MSAARLPEKNHDVFHIVGQGLAGSVLALLLMEQGFRVHVHDNGYQTSSSRVAAGMWNPVSFVNLKASWKALETVECMEGLYPKLERTLGASFFHPTSLVRIFPDAGAANVWEERKENPALQPFISEEEISGVEMHFHQPNGHGEVLRSGWLDLPAFLDASRSYFQSNDCFTEHDVSAADQEQWLAQGDWVIQCTGWKKLSDDFGADLPLMANKGQVYTLSIPELDANYMSNFGRFTIPLGNGLFRVGSTYEHRPTDPLPSAVAQEILEDVAHTIKHAFTVVDLKAGYRPTTIDRFPIVGLHPQQNHLGIFTGFGSRGVITVPLCAVDFVAHITSGAPLMPEVDWTRFARRKGLR